MSRVISSKAELDAYFDDLEHESFSMGGVMAEKVEDGLELVTLEMALDAPHNPDVMAEGGNPWNAAASIGVDERIPAAKAKIPGLAERRDYHIQVDGEGIGGVIGEGMLYLPKLDDQTWREPALDRAPKVIGRELEAGLDTIERRVAP